MDESTTERGMSSGLSGAGASPSESALEEGGNGVSNGKSRGRALGWLSLGLGAAELAAPRMLASGLGLGKGTATNRVIRLLGAREILAGLGLLRRRSPRGWLWARVVGDVMNLALLGASLRTMKRKRRTRVPLALFLVAGVTLADVLAARHAGKQSRMAAATL